MFGNMPFYPDMCGREETCMSFPLFKSRGKRPHMPDCAPMRPDPCFSCGKLPGSKPCMRPEPCDCRSHWRPDPCCTRPPVPVKLVNPCDPCECATVLLSVDACGNLQICIRRD